MSMSHHPARIVAGIGPPHNQMRLLVSISVWWVVAFVCPSLSDYLDMISRRGHRGTALDPHISKVVVPELITGKSCRSIVRGEVPTAQRDSRKGRHIIASVGGVANRKPLDGPKRTRNGYGTLSRKIPIATVNVIRDPISLWNDVRPSPSRRDMAKDYQRLWKDVTSTHDEGQVIRTLAKILADREGRNFISNSLRKDAELCIELLDRVSRALHQHPFSAVLYASSRVSRSTTSKRRRNRLSSSH